MNIDNRIVNAFVKETNQLNFIKIFKKDDNFYYTVSNCIIYKDVLSEGQFEFEIVNLNEPKDIGPLNELSSKVYIYVESLIRPSEGYQISTSSIIDSPKILPFVEISDFGTQSKSRALLGIIGFQGRKCVARPFQAQITYNEDCFPIFPNNIFTIQSQPHEDIYQAAIESSISYSPIKTHSRLYNGFPISYLDLLV